MPTIQGVTVAGHSVLLPEDRLGSVTLLLLWTREHGQVSCTIANKGDGLETHWNKNVANYLSWKRLCKNLVVHCHVCVVFLSYLSIAICTCDY